jgi:hypothetical protein
MSNVQQMHTPSKERVEAIRRFHIDQAVGAAVPVAMVNVTITWDGEINTKGLGLNDQLARTMVNELRALILRIESQLPEEDAPMAQPEFGGNVVALRR